MRKGIIVNLKKDIHKIYFDMDGVVADFDRGVLELCHMFPLEQEISTPEENDRLYEKMREVDHFYGNLKLCFSGNCIAGTEKR